MAKSKTGKKNGIPSPKNVTPTLKKKESTPSQKVVVKNEQNKTPKIQKESPVAKILSAKQKKTSKAQKDSNVPVMKRKEAIKRAQEVSDDSDSSDAPVAKVVKQKAHSPKVQQELPSSKAVKRKAKDELLQEAAKRNRKFSETDEDLLAENQQRFVDQRNRTLFVSLPGKLGKVSMSALKALHPDILNVNQLAHCAFLIFASGAVRDKALPAIEKAHLKNQPLKVGKATLDEKKQPAENVGINLSQLVVSDLPKDITNNVLEIVFPKSNDIKIINSRQLAYINFESEGDALEAFKKGKMLKISSVPVVVRYRYALMKEEGHDENAGAKTELSKKPKLADGKGDSKKAKPLNEKSKKAVESDSDDGLDSDDGMDFGEEGFEDISTGSSDFEDEEGEFGQGLGIPGDSSDEDE